MTDVYQKAAYILLRQKDGSIDKSIPLYVKVTNPNKNGVSDMQEKLINTVSEIMIRRYDTKISQVLAIRPRGGGDNAKV